MPLTNVSFRLVHLEEAVAFLKRDWNENVGKNRVVLYRYKLDKGNDLLFGEESWEVVHEDSPGGNKFFHVFVLRHGRSFIQKRLLSKVLKYDLVQANHWSESVKKIVDDGL